MGLIRSPQLHLFIGSTTPKLMLLSAMVAFLSAKVGWSVVHANAWRSTRHTYWSALLCSRQDPDERDERVKWAEMSALQAFMSYKPHKSRCTVSVSPSGQLHHLCSLLHNRQLFNLRRFPTALFTATTTICMKLKCRSRKKNMTFQ